MGTLQELGSRAGSRLGVSDWALVDLATVRAFGRTTLEPGVDAPADEGAEPRLHDLIAQGLLTLSIAISLASPFTPMPDDVRSALNYGFDRIRFIAPVEVGQRIRVAVDLIDVEQLQPLKWRGAFDLTVEIDGSDRPAASARWLIVYLLRQPPVA